MKLFTYFRSSAAYRVRIALQLKGISAEAVDVHLLRSEQTSSTYLGVNPAGLIPTLEHDGVHLVQSLAIIEYLEDLEPIPPLLPAEPSDRAFVRSIALSIACDIHPLDNLRVLRYLKQECGLADDAVDRWYAHWIALGFTELEARLSRDARVGRFCYGDSPTLADVCLVPQMTNAERMKCPLDAYPTLRRLTDNARALPAFRAAAPQPDPAADVRR